MSPWPWDLVWRKEPCLQRSDRGREKVGLFGAPFTYLSKFHGLLLKRNVSSHQRLPNCGIANSEIYHSLVADVLMLKRIIEDPTKKAILVLPYVALVQEKLQWLRKVVDGVSQTAVQVVGDFGHGLLVPQVGPSFTHKMQS